MKAFQDERSVLWLAGVALGLLALFIAFVVMPARTPLEPEPDVQVDLPRMQNVPPPAAERMKVESSREP